MKTKIFPMTVCIVAALALVLPCHAQQTWSLGDVSFGADNINNVTDQAGLVGTSPTNPYPWRVGYMDYFNEFEAFDQYWSWKPADETGVYNRTGSYGYVAQNLSGIVKQNMYNAYWGVYEKIFAPGDNSGGVSNYNMSAVAFIAEEDGYYEFNILFYGRALAGATVNTYLLEGSSLTSAADFVAGVSQGVALDGFYGTEENNYADRFGSNPMVSYALENYYMSAGQVLYAAYDAGHDGFGDDEIGIGFNIQKEPNEIIPEPATLAYAAMGLASLVGMRRFKK